MIEKTANANSKKTAFIEASSWVVCQRCLLCNNTHEIPHGYGVGNYPWVCDECKEAIDFLKFLKSHEQKLIKTIMEASE